MLLKERLTSAKIIFFLIVLALALVGLWFINKNANDNYNRDEAHWQQYQTAIADTRAEALRGEIATHRQAVEQLAEHTGMRVFFSELHDDVQKGVVDLNSHSLLAASRNPANALLAQDLVNKMAEESGLSVSGTESNLFSGLTVMTADGAEIVSNDNLPQALKAQLSQTAFDASNMVYVEADGVAYFVHQAPIKAIASVAGTQDIVGYIRGVTPVSALVPPVLDKPATFAATDLSQLVSQQKEGVFIYDALRGIMVPNNADDVDAAIAKTGMFVSALGAEGKETLSVAKDVMPGLQLVHSVGMEESIHALEKRKTWQRAAGLLLLLASLLALLLVHHYDVSKHYKEKARMQEEVVDSMVELMERRDSYTANHSKRVAELAAKMAAEANLSAPSQKATKYAATLMNVGKSLIPLAILSKPTKLTAKEKEVVNASLAASADIVKDIDFDAPVYETMMQIKEQVDGKGPLGLEGKHILSSAKIVALANAYVAMSSPRAYRKKLSKTDIMRHLKKDTGTLFDPETVNLLTRVL